MNNEHQRLIGLDLPQQLHVLRFAAQAEGDDRYIDYGVALKYYEEAFKLGLKGATLTDIINRRAGSIVIDLMAPTKTLTQLFGTASPDPHRLGIAVALEDRRNIKQRLLDEEY